MANFDMAELALKSVAPSNKIIYDDKEMPSIMCYIPKFRLCDVLSTADTSVHPAFRRNGAEFDGFYVGKYGTKHYNGRAYSLPAEDPQANTNLDTFVSYAKAKGAGHHEITAVEWAAIALWCHKNGTEPKGNNNYGKDTTETLYKAIPSMARDASDRIQRVATGTGPITWSHDGTLEGIWDMNGNVVEWCTGLRLKYGELQILEDNNASLDTADLSDESNAWKAIDAATGNLVAPHRDANDKYDGQTSGSVKLDYVSSKWKYVTTIAGTTGSYNCAFKDVQVDVDISAGAILLLQALAMYPDANLTGTGIDTTYGGDYFYAHNGEAERSLVRGGYWGLGAFAGVFGSGLYSHRSGAYVSIGGRSAYIE